MGKYSRYLHHGLLVWVRADLQGKHREHSLCHSCKHEGNCHIIAVIYEFCKLVGVTLPVWECPAFGPKEEGS